MDRRQDSKSDILLIIIDQLRVDYLPFLEKTGLLLPYHAICTTGSIPSSTEAMHTNISTGLWPKDHGFISKNPKGKEKKGQGLDQLLEKFKQGTITPIGHIAAANGYQVINLGGKKETVLTMCTREYAQAQVYIDKNRLSIYGKQQTLVDKLESAIANYGYETIQVGDLSLPLLSLLKEVNSSYDYSSPKFITLALPDLDFIGHKFGPGSAQAVEHVLTLDKVLADMLAQTFSSFIVILGDHGCRRTRRYVMETKNPFLAQCYYEENEEFYPGGVLSFDDANLAQIEYDGGLLRMWFSKSGSFLSEDPIAILSEYGRLIDSRIPYSAKLQAIVSRSIHENFGELTFIAHPDATFCKYVWIPEGNREAVNTAQALAKGSLPIGEHGTYHGEDVLVPLLSNRELEKKIYDNVDISALIKNKICQ